MAKKRSKKRTTTKRRIKRNPIAKKYRRKSLRNDPAKRSHRRSKRYRRNPVPANINNILWVGTGFLGTKFAGNMIAPAIGMTKPITRIGVKAGIAFIGGKFVVGRFIGKSAGENFFIGGIVEVISEVVKNFLAPSIPALAAYEEPMQIEGISEYNELEAYPGELEAYPELEGVEQEEEVYS